MVTVEHIKKSFGNITAVDDLSFSIEKGEIVGFLGPNGAGKTTTMRIITGYIAPDEGTVTVEGIAVSDKAEDAQQVIGYLPENNPLYKDMLVADLLSLSADLRGIKKDKRAHALDFVVTAAGISGIFYRPIRELSKGFSQRVGIAVALLHQPRIIIMDEPTEGLDPNQRAEIRALIKTLARDRTIIMSTHVMQEAAAVCNRLLVIANGKLVADGSLKEVMQRARGERILVVEVEGKQVADSLSSLSGVKRLDVSSKRGERIAAKLLLDSSASVQPELSRLAHQNNWTIWHLAEEERSLEDVFRELTKTV